MPRKWGGVEIAALCCSGRAFDWEGHGFSRAEKLMVIACPDERYEGGS